MLTNYKPPRWSALVISGALVASVVGVGAAIAAGEDAFPCPDQIAALEKDVFGDTIPTDPDVLRELTAEFEAKFETVCSPNDDGSRVNVELTEEDRTSYVPDQGIFPATEDILPVYDLTNYWVGKTGPGETDFVWVYAGLLSEDPKQGGVIVVAYGSGPGPFIPTPVAGGSVEIVKSDDTALMLTIQSEDGIQFTFDVAKGAFE